MECPQGEAAASRCQLNPAAQAGSIAKSDRAQRVATTAKLQLPLLARESSLGSLNCRRSFRA